MTKRNWFFRMIIFFKRGETYYKTVGETGVKLSKLL